jgi:hypothetical protein
MPPFLIEIIMRKFFAVLKYVIAYRKGAKGAKFQRLLTILLIPSLSIGTLKMINIPNFKSDNFNCCANDLF